MQLDQSSLEQLEPKTKAMIRTFGRKAKDSNRLDVFEHLREITPAGTTGESIIFQASCYIFLLCICGLYFLSRYFNFRELLHGEFQPRLKFQPG